MFALTEEINELFDPESTTRSRLSEKFAELINQAKERRETLKELKENPVIFTFKKHGILHEIKKRDIDNYIKTSTNFKNIILDDLSKADQ